MKSRRVRLSICFLVSCLSVAFGTLYWQWVRANTYAFTISLGNDIGFTVFNASYYEQPEIAQEIIRAHEDRHLKDGTWQFWRPCEARALEAEIEFIRNRKIQLSSLIKKNRNFLYDYHVLDLFERNATIQLGQITLCSNSQK